MRPKDSKFDARCNALEVALDQRADGLAEHCLPSRRVLLEDWP